MGSASVLQLVAIGAQDKYLSDQPQITFFKSVHKRHTNFANEQIEIPMSGSVYPGSKVSVLITRNGDLLKGITIQYNPSKLIPANNKIKAITSDIGHSLFDQIDIEIGGQLIDRHYGKWLTVWRDLTDVNPYSGQFPIYAPGGSEVQSYYKDLDFTKETDPTSNRQGEITIQTIQTQITQYNTMAYTHAGFINPAASSGILGIGTQYAPTEAYVPMQFWFCRNPGLALPLIALQYHEVKLNITFSKKDAFIIPFTPTDINNINIDLTSIKIFGDYVFLDSIERRQFSQNAHEYLIDQIQYITSDTSNINSTELNFNHPVKELIITGKPQFITNKIQINTNPDNAYLTPGYVGVWGSATPYPIITKFASVPNSIIDSGAITNLQIQLVLNQNDRFSARNLKYFTRFQLLDSSHKGSGSLLSSDSIAIYSFAIKPQDFQPSGSCNFSRIDRATLYFSERDTNETLNPLDIYALNHNIFRVMSGMGGLAYSN